MIATLIQSRRSVYYISLAALSGSLVGRALLEAMPDGAMPEWRATTQISDRDTHGQVTIVTTQSIGSVRYFDVAGYPGRTIGLPEQADAGKTD